MRAAFLFVATLLVAGCLEGAPSQHLNGQGPASSIVDPDWYLNAVDVPDGHNHGDLKQHADRSTPNFQILAYDEILVDHYGETVQDYGCSATSEKDGRRLTVVSSFASDLTFVIYDVTDLAQPRKIGELVMANVMPYDIGITPDQRFVLVATSLLDSGPDLPPTPVVPIIEFRDACTGETRTLQGPVEQVPFYSGLVLIDISDPSEPTVADYWPAPVEGGHSLQTATIKGRDLILLTVFEFVHEASYYLLMDVEPTPIGPRLRVLSVIPGLEPDGSVWGAAGVPGVHDGYLNVHPITGEAIASLAVGPTGLRFYNIDDPTKPRLISIWKDFSAFGDAAPPTWYWHTTLALDVTWEGRHYTFASEECPAHRVKMASCAVLALDTTDPTKPTFAGGWAMPADAPWEEIYEFSTHHIAIIDRTLFITLFHGGLWAIDVSTPENIWNMPSVGVFMPDREPEHPRSYPRRSAAMVPFFDGTIFQHAPVVIDLDAVPEHNALIVPDMFTGLYVVRFDAANPAPSPDPWPFPFNQ